MEAEITGSSALTDDEYALINICATVTKANVAIPGANLMRLVTKLVTYMNDKTLAISAQRAELSTLRDENARLRRDNLVLSEQISQSAVIEEMSEYTRRAAVKTDGLNEMRKNVNKLQNRYGR